MSSYADVKIGGEVLYSTQNYYYEWYFRKSERSIDAISSASYYSDAERSADEMIDVYHYKTLGTTLRRRLELAGYDNQSLAQEFKIQREQLIKDVEEMVEISPNGEAARFLSVIKSSSLEDWLSRLKIIIEKKLDIDFFSKEKIEYGDELLTFMLRHDVFFTERPTAGSYSFPCLSIECYAIALLQILPENIECILDVTDLVNGGWTDAFNDLEEFKQEFTTFYQIYLASIEVITGLMKVLPENEMLIRMLYANIITAMETYLSDTLKKQVLNREAIKRRFVRNHDGFKDKKFIMANIFEKFFELKEEIISEIDKISFHNLDKIPGLYKSVLDTEFPSCNLAALRKAVNNRHDIVHRNGKNTFGQFIQLNATDVEQLIILVNEVVVHIDKQIKDGLLADIDMEPVVI